LNKLRVSVIGVGKLGSIHTRIYNELENTFLTSVVDIDEERAKEISKKYNIKYFTDYKKVEDVDAVSICVPTPLHFEVSKYFLENGVHVLVEKPICKSLKEARILNEISKENNLVLQVGHIERYNPAVRKAFEFVKSPRYIEAHRISSYDPRVSDTDVILDLMIHDIDIILYLVNSKIVSFDAVGTKVISGNTDIACCYMRFENGCYVNIMTSRLSMKKLRKIRIFQDDSYISLNYARPSLKVYMKKKEKIESLKDIKIVKVKLEKREPLKDEISDFVDACIKRRKPSVSGEEAATSLEVALKIIDKIEGRI